MFSVVPAMFHTLYCRRRSLAYVRIADLLNVVRNIGADIEGDCLKNELITFFFTETFQNCSEDFLRKVSKTSEGNGCFRLPVGSYS